MEIMKFLHKVLALAMFRIWLMDRMEHTAYWQNVLHRILIQTLLTKERREAEFLMLGAAERFEKFKEEHPALIQRLKQQEVAEYLGISPVHLSRIRSQK